VHILPDQPPDGGQHIFDLAIGQCVRHARHL
jgi:hypothetical protein